MKNDHARLMDMLDNLAHDMRGAYGFETDHVQLKSAEREIEKAKRLVMKIARERDQAVERLKEIKALLRREPLLRQRERAHELLAQPKKARSRAAGTACAEVPGGGEQA